MTHTKFLLSLAIIPAVLFSSCGPGQPTVITPPPVVVPLAYVSASVVFGNNGASTTRAPQDFDKKTGRTYSEAGDAHGSTVLEIWRKSQVYSPKVAHFFSESIATAGPSCAGKGLCGPSVVNSYEYTNASSIQATFAFQAGTAPSVQMVFNLFQLMANQPAAVKDFYALSVQQQPKTYAFDAPFDISTLSSVFAGKITPAKPGAITVQPLNPDGTPNAQTTVVVTFPLL